MISLYALLVKYILSVEPSCLIHHAINHFHSTCYIQVSIYFFSFFSSVFPKASPITRSSILATRHADLLDVATYAVFVHEV